MKNGFVSVNFRCPAWQGVGKSLVMVIVSMYLLDLEAACKPTQSRGVKAQPRGASMRQEIVAQAKEMFPNAPDELAALEALLFAVYSTIDDILFAQEDAKEYPCFDDVDSDTDADVDADADFAWDYVY